MALNKTAFVSELKNVFSSMRTDSDFANGLSVKTKAFIESGKVTTTDSGTIMSGNATFLGSGEGSMTVVASLMQNKITPVFAQMKTQNDDSKLSKGIADGVKAMAEASNTVSTDVSGNATSTSSGVVSPVSGQGSGSFSGNSSTIESKLNSCFSKMKTYKICYKKNGSFYSDEDCTVPYTVPDGAETKETYQEKHQYIAFFGDAYFAECLADAVESYLKAGSIRTTDSGSLSGASGSGSIA